MTEPTFINPEGVFDPSPIYSHVAIAPPGRVAFFAGQWGASVDGTLVSEEFEPQVAQALANVRAVLAGAGLEPRHVARVTHYVVGLDDERRASLHRQMGATWAGSRPASTLLGVARLAREGMLYEIDIAAVLPD